MSFLSSIKQAFMDPTQKKLVNQADWKAELTQERVERVTDKAMDMLRDSGQGTYEDVGRGVYVALSLAREDKPSGTLTFADFVGAAQQLGLVSRMRNTPENQSALLGAAAFITAYVADANAIARGVQPGASSELSAV